MGTGHSLSKVQGGTADIYSLRNLSKVLDVLAYQRSKSPESG